jgi:tetratricopeptide (TPR) repeat protein
MVKNASKLILPTAPSTETGPVKAWSEPVVLRTYEPSIPDKNPMFLEKRVYQGSSGRVYPLPVIDRIATVPEERSWQAIHIENDQLRFMILPQIGGRIHVGLDKSNGYDFFYRQNVIKPALVGLAGPWVSGGVEFNWPQHHRPATYMPAETSIERSDDGSVTVWCSDHDPMERMKGMHGICLRPGKAFLELRVRLYNRTTDTKTFLWWANVAVSVHERYQSFFPRDVRYVADHAKRAVTEFPLSQGTYYGVDYGKRREHGVVSAERPSRFQPDGTFAPNDLSSYANIPVPTSYMVSGSRGDFSGGYDFTRKAGVVSVANHHVVPGKKQWTWGNHEFGYSWDRNLTEADGPYVELMVGAYTDNQPDFSFLAPGETKSFSQYWYPLREIGVPDIANVDAALRLESGTAETVVHLQVTSARPNSTVTLLSDNDEVGRWEGDLFPESPLHHCFPSGSRDALTEVRVEHNGEVILQYSPYEIFPTHIPQVATEPPLPENVATNDELFLTGLHLEQYRHPTRCPEFYWQEGLRRDPNDSRINHAMGRWHLRRGEFKEAEARLRTALKRQMQLNANPYDGEPLYHLGLTLEFQDRLGEAYDYFYKSTWNAAWRGPGYFRLAEIDCTRREWAKALKHIDRSLCADADNLNALNLRFLILEKLGNAGDAISLLEKIVALDPLDTFSRFLRDKEIPQDGQRCLDLAFDLMRAGFHEHALHVLSVELPWSADGSATMKLYARAEVLDRLGRYELSQKAYHEAAQGSPDYVFPNRLEEMVLLRKAVLANPSDARAFYYLGNILYDRHRHAEAISCWEHSVERDARFPTVWRNLGFGYFNVLHDERRACEAFCKAFELSPNDPRILYEYDQLLKKTGASLNVRLKMLCEHEAEVLSRDDLSVELASVLNSTGDPNSALRVPLARQFQPWEGGEGLVLEQYVRARILLAQETLKHGDHEGALGHLLAAGRPPSNLNEVRHPLTNENSVDYWLGIVYAGLRRDDEARAAWERAATSQSDFQRMQPQPVSESTFWSGMALNRLERHEEARRVFDSIAQYADDLKQKTPKVDYFATSLPTMLLFEEDLYERQQITADFLKAQALIGRNDQENGLGIALLEAVLQHDCSHTGAIDLLCVLKG